MKTSIDGWELNDWNGEFTTTCMEVDGPRSVEILGDKLRLTNDSCCRSDFGSPVPCSVSIPLTVLKAFLAKAPT